MKKVLFIAVAFVACCTFNSCKKTCTCTEAVTGVSETMETDMTYKSCQDFEDLYRTTASRLDASWQKWSCKQK